MHAITERWTAFAASQYFWDWIALACGVVAVAGFLWLLVLILGLPGRIAVARNHPDAEAVYAMGWVGFAAIVPWIQALIWAFKPTDKVDIRYFPEAERISEQESLERLAAYAYGKKHPPPERDAAIDAAIDREAGPAFSAEAASAPAQTPAGAGPAAEPPALEDSTPTDAPPNDAGPNDGERR